MKTGGRSGGISGCHDRNRELLEIKTVRVDDNHHQEKNADLITACILPEVECTDEENILIKLIIDQIEMHFLLYHREFFPCQQPVKFEEKTP